MRDDLTLQNLLRSMNRHLPAKRPSLEELLEEEEPVYRGKDGVEYRVGREELEMLASHLDWRYRRKLKIPIFISTDTSYPGGAWKVMGKAETAAISSIIGREPEFEDQLRLFFPHLSSLRDLLPTTTMVMYMP
ncbi:MAG: DUF61 family protein [Methanomassiliicoccales archaeon]